MPTAFVLVNSELSSDMEIIAKIKEIFSTEKDIQYEIQGVYGVYDLIVKVSSNDGPKLRKIITTQIRKIDKVQSTLTMMVIEEQE
uniref:Transcriptional regulator AsnC family n=1 Tax=uncultured marine thaumarchaeote KM3_49_A08 TaxID=1456171 RepID=A0A075H9J0_9ARCH|nr:transcriptional regulator AsnC family [uncultured marine thaumarchaeote KM3_49_A08]